MEVEEIALEETPEQVEIDFEETGPVEDLAPVVPEVEEITGPLGQATNEKLQEEIDEEASTATVLTAEEEALSATFRDQQELIRSYGSSQDLDDIRDVLDVVDQEDRDAMAISVVHSTLTETQKLQYLTALGNQTSAKNLSSKALLTKALAYKAEPRTDLDAPALDSTFERLDQIERASFEVDSLFNAYGLEFSAGMLETGLDLTTSILPGSYAYQTYEVIDAAVPGLVKWHDTITTGHLQERLAEHISNLPVEQQVTTLRGLIKSLNEEKYAGMHNEFTKFLIAEAILQPGGPTDTMKWVESFFGLLDYGIGIQTFRGLHTAGKLAKMSPKARKAYLATYRGLENIDSRTRKNSVLSTVAQVDPQKAERLAYAALQDGTGGVADMLRVNGEEITVTSVLPNKPGDPVQVAPDLNIRDNSTIAFNDEELADIVNTLDQRVNLISDSGPTMHISKSSIADTGDGFEARYTFGATQDHGFKTIAHAQAAMKMFKQLDHDVEMTLLVRRDDIGEFLPEKELLSLEKQHSLSRSVDKEFLVALDINVKPTSAHAKALNPVRKDGISGKLASWFDKNAWADSWLIRAGNQAVDMASLIRSDLTKVLDPLYKLGDDQKLVFQALELGEKELNPLTGKPGIWLTRKDLYREFKDEKNFEGIVEAYTAVRNHQTIVREYLNAGFRKRLVGEGMRAVRIKRKDGGNDQTIGKFTRTVPRDIKRVWDPEIQEVRDIDAAEILGRLDDGEQFVQFRAPIVAGKDRPRYSLAPSQSKHLSVTELPMNIIRDNPGYITRLYDAAYVVRKPISVRKDTSLSADDTGDWQTVAIENNLADAMKYWELEKAAAEAAGKKFDLEMPVRSSELGTDAPKYGTDASLDEMERTGQLFYSTRGDEILGLGGERRLESIASSLDVARNKASKIGTIDATVDKLTANWEKMWGQRFGEPPGTMPMFEDIRAGRIGPAEQRDYKDAIAFRDHIKLIAGLSNSKMQANWKEFVINTAEGLLATKDNWWRRKLSQGLLLSRDMGTMNSIKTLSFYNLIVANPVRQAVLQANQMSVYLGRGDASTYFFTEGGTRDFVGLITGLSTRNNPEQYATIRKTMSKQMKLSPKEYDEFVDAYLRTGLHDSIDSHVWVQMMDLDRRLASPEMKNLLGTAAGDSVLSGVNSSKQLFKYMRRIGFDAGEKFQLAAAYLTERNKFIKDNPTKSTLWNTPRNLAKIGGDARGLSFNMNQSGALAFQRIPVLSVMFQFMSHTTKSLQFMVPNTKILGMNKIAMKHVTNSERMKTLFNQFLIYGTGGFGIAGGMELLNEKFAGAPPQAIAISEEMILGSVINGIIGVVEGDLEFPTDIEFSGSISPLSGALSKNNPAARVYDWLFLENVPLSSMAGPWMSTAKNLLAGVDHIGYILGEATGFTTEQEVAAMLAEAGNMASPTFSRLARMRYQQSVGRLVSNSGSESVRATGAELWANALLGVNPREKRQITDELFDIKGLPGPPQREAMYKELQEEGDRIYENTMRLMRLFVDGEMTSADVLKRFQLTAELNKEIFPDYEHDTIYDRVRDRIVRDRSKSGVETELALLLTKMFGEGMSNPQDKIRQIKAMSPFEEQDDLVELLEKMVQ